MKLRDVSNDPLPAYARIDLARDLIRAARFASDSALVAPDGRTGADACLEVAEGILTEISEADEVFRLEPSAKDRQP